MDGVISIQPEENVTPDWTNLKKKDGWDRLKQSEKDFLIGKMEGTLSEEEDRELHERLLQDTMLAAEYAVYLKTRLQKDESAHSGLITALKKGEIKLNAANAHDVFLLAIDDSSLQKLVHDWVQQHASFEAEWQLVQQLHMVADQQIQMPNKESLKKKDREGIVVFMPWLYRAAAVAAMITLIWNFWPETPNKTSTEQFAHSDQNESIKHENESPVNHDAIEMQTVHQEQTLANDVTPQRVKKPRVIRKDQESIQEQQEQKELRDEEPSPLLVKQELPKQDSVQRVPLKKELNLQNPSITVEAFYADASVKEKEKILPNSNGFTAMQTLVEKSTKGFIEVDRQEKADSRKFSLKVGNVKFTRKKNRIDE